VCSGHRCRVQEDEGEDNGDVDGDGNYNDGYNDDDLVSEPESDLSTFHYSIQ
jgi:hypothetical protein